MCYFSCSDISTSPNHDDLRSLYNYLVLCKENRKLRTKTFILRRPFIGLATKVMIILFNFF